MDAMLGRVLGHYELVARLGSGGMGAVYRGVHQTLQQPRAVKILRPDLANEPDVVARFRREAMIAAGLRHQNIVLIYDVAEHDDVHYIVMDLLEGGSLRDLVRASAPLPLERTVALLGQLASALDYAHGRGVIHRDIKPGNVMVGDDDRVTLVDFGIARAAEEARLTRSGTIVGTAEYMAPEAFTSSGSEKTGDLYALGIIAYELLTGHAPFRGNPTAVSYAQVNTPPPPARTLFPGVPAPVEAALLRQVSKDPTRRFPDATSFVEALGSAGQDAESEDAPTTAFDRTSIAPLPERPQSPTVLHTPQPGVHTPQPDVPAPTMMQTPPPGTQTPPPGMQTPPPGSPAPTMMQTPYPGGSAPGMMQAPPPGMQTPPPGGPPAAYPSYPGVPPGRPGAGPGPYGQRPSSSGGATAKRLAAFVVVVLALVVVGSLVIWQTSFRSDSVAEATPEPTARPTVASAQATLPPTAPPAAKPTAPPAAKPTAAPTAPAKPVAAEPTAAPAAKPTEPAAAKPTAPPAAKPTAAPAVVAAAPTAALPPTSSPPPPVFRTVLDERFVDNQRSWPNDPEGTAQLTEGVYRLVAREPNQFVSVGPTGLGTFGDVEVSGRFRKVGGPPGGGFGIIVRDQGPPPRNGVKQDGRYYVLEVGEGTQWGMWRRETDTWIDLQVWTESSAVKPPPEVNELTVRAIGNRLIFIVNGIQVANMEEPTLPRGEVGIYVAGDGNIVEVEQFVVRAPQ